MTLAALQEVRLPELSKENSKYARIVRELLLVGIASGGVSLAELVSGPQRLPLHKSFFSTLVDASSVAGFRMGLFSNW